LQSFYRSWEELQHTALTHRGRHLRSLTHPWSHDSGNYHQRKCEMCIGTNNKQILSRNTSASCIARLYDSNPQYRDGKQELGGRREIGGNRRNSGGNHVGFKVRRVGPVATITTGILLYCFFCHSFGGEQVWIWGH
jgi:hypothetical protein